MTNLPKVVTCKQNGKESDFSVVAVWLLLYYKFTAESVLKEFLKLLNIRQRYGEKGNCLKCPVHQGPAVLKYEFAWDLMYGGQKLLRYD